MKDVGSFDISFEDLSWDIKEVYLLMGYGDCIPSLEVVKLIRETLEEIKPLLSLHCSYILKEGHTDGREKLIIDEVEFMTGRIITHALNGASSYVFFTATIGSGFDNYCRHLKSGDDELKIFVADMIGSVIAEDVVSWLMGKLKDLAEEEGWLISNNYSPGYCDWALVEQQKLFGFFPENITGIRLTDSCLMLPIKSVSGVVAIGVGIKKRPYGCSICKMPTCFRNKRRL